MPRPVQEYENVRNLQRKLYVKAKQEKEFKFYSLYDKIYRQDVLQYAWAKCKANKGHRESTDGHSRLLRNVRVLTYSLARWPANLERESTSRNPSGGCIYPSWTEVKDRLVFRVSRTAWPRWLASS